MPLHAAGCRDVPLRAVACCCVLFRAVSGRDRGGRQGGAMGGNGKEDSSEKLDMMQREAL